MEALEYKILAKRQELRDLLRFAMQQAPVFLPIIRELRFELTVCDCALTELYAKRTYVRLG